MNISLPGQACGDAPTMIEGLSACAKFASAVGLACSIGSTLYQGYKRRQPNPISWNASTAIQLFGSGALVGTVASVPYLVWHEVCIAFCIPAPLVTLEHVSPLFGVLTGVIDGAAIAATDCVLAHKCATMHVTCNFS